MLADAVRKLKGQAVEPIPTTVLDIRADTYIPKNYISIDRHRMDAYRKIAVAKTNQDLKQIADEMTDVYGQMPPQAKLLLELAELRIKASKFDIKSIITDGRNLIFSFTKEPDKKTKALFDKVTAKADFVNPKTVYLRLDKNYFQPQTLITILRKIFSIKN